MLAASFRGFRLHAEAAVDDGQDVVGGKVVGVDGLDGLVLGPGVVVLVLLVVAEAELAVGVAADRGNCFRDLTADL